MKNKILGVLVAAAALTTGCATEQAKPQCAVGHGEFIIKYYPKDPSNLCGAIANTGEAMAIVKYPAFGDSPGTLAMRLPEVYGTIARGYNAAGTPVRTLGLRSLRGAEEFWDGSLEWNAIGAYSVSFAREYDVDVDAGSVGTAQFDASDEPGADNYCRVTDFELTGSAGEATAVVQDAANFELIASPVAANPDRMVWRAVENAPTEVVQGAQDVTYAFKNMAFYVTTQSPGVTFQADLTYTETITGVGAGESCTAEYTAIGLAPAFNPLYGGRAGPNTCRDDADCDPCAYAPDGTYVVGSGIGPDLDVVCDPDIYGGFCFLRETTAGQAPELPSLLTQAQIDERTAQCARNQRGEG